MRRGEIRLTDLDPARGSEANKLPGAAARRDHGPAGGLQSLGRAGALRRDPAAGPGSWAAARTDLAYRHRLLVQAVGNGTTMDAIRAGELVHGLAGLVLLDDLGSLGTGETALRLAWGTRRRRAQVCFIVRLIPIVQAPETGEDVWFPREMFC
jgi:hypothetical protein